MLLAIDDTAAAQLIAAMQQLNYKVLLGGHPGTFTLETLRKFKDNTKGTLLAESFPYPSQNNEKNFPGLKKFFADMKASGKSILDPNKLQPTSFYPWVSTLAFVNVLANVDTVTKESVIDALRPRKTLISKAWLHRGLRRPRLQLLRIGVQPLRLHLALRRQERRDRQGTDRRHAVLQVAR